MLTTPTAIQPGTFSFQAFQSGDQAVLKQVFQRYYRPLCQYAYKMLGAGPIIEEIVTDAFVKLYQHRTGIESFFHLQNFLYTCTRHDCISYYHQQRRQRRRLDELPDEPLIIDPTNDPENRHGQALSLIYALGNQLPPVCRKVFQLFFLEGKTTIEIAQALDLRPQTVLNQKTRAIMLLRKALSNRL